MSQTSAQTFKNNSSVGVIINACLISMETLKFIIMKIIIKKKAFVCINLHKKDEVKFLMVIFRCPYEILKLVRAGCGDY